MRILEIYRSGNLEINFPGKQTLLGNGNDGNRVKYYWVLYLAHLSESSSTSTFAYLSWLYASAGQGPQCFSMGGQGSIFPGTKIGRYPFYHLNLVSSAVLFLFWDFVKRSYSTSFSAEFGVPT